MINVIREPISWFSSHYHFKLYGWSRKPGQRGDQNEMTLQECIDSDAPTCSRNHWRYMEFFCGSGPECQSATNQNDEAEYKTRMLEKAKQRVLNDYFVIGVLEQFEDSLRVFLKNFCQDIKATVGVEFATMIMKMDDGKNLKLQIWDTAGQERYRAITNAYYRGAWGAILVYDITRRKTFENMPRWMKELKDHANRDITLILVGNKTDLAESKEGAREVTKEMLNQFANEYDIKAFEASAKDGTNVDEAFRTCVVDIYEGTLKRNNNRYSRNPSVITIEGFNSGSSKGCCK